MLINLMTGSIQGCHNDMKFGQGHFWSTLLRFIKNNISTKQSLIDGVSVRQNVLQIFQMVLVQLAKVVDPWLAVCGIRWEMVRLRNRLEMVNTEIPIIWSVSEMLTVGLLLRFC